MKYLKLRLGEEPPAVCKEEKEKYYKTWWFLQKSNSF